MGKRSDCSRKAGRDRAGTGAPPARHPAWSKGIEASKQPPGGKTGRESLGGGRDTLTSEPPSRAGCSQGWGLACSRAAWRRSRSGREGGSRAGIRARGCGRAVAREKGGSTDLRGGGRGGGVPPPETGRVGCWSRVEGCARRLWRELENRAESAQSGGGRALGMGRWGWRTG